MENDRVRPGHGSYSTNFMRKNDQPTLLARALYDNESDFSQEITFKKGDVLSVLKKDPEGYEGWWICSLRGNVGIAPGNRLEILGTIIPKSPATLEPDPYDQIPFSRDAAPPEITVNHPENTAVIASCYENVSVATAGKQKICLPALIHRQDSPHSAIEEGRADIDELNERKANLDQDRGSPDRPEQHSLERHKAIGSSEKHTVRFIDPPAEQAAVNMLATPLPDLAARSAFSPKKQIEKSMLPWSKSKSRLHGFLASEKKIEISEPIRCTNRTNAHLLNPTIMHDTVEKPHSKTTIEKSVHIPTTSICENALDVINASGLLPSTPTDGSLSSNSTSPRPIVNHIEEVEAGIGDNFGDPMLQWTSINSKINGIVDDILNIIEQEEKRRNIYQNIMKKIDYSVRGLIKELSTLCGLVENAKRIAIKNRMFLLQQRFEQYETDIQREIEALTLSIFHTKGLDLKVAFFKEDVISAICTSLQGVQLIMTGIMKNIIANPCLLVFDSESEASVTTWVNETWDRTPTSLSSTLTEDQNSTTTRTSFSGSLDETTGSQEPLDLPGLLYFYAAQIHSHNLLIKGTVDEFLSCLRIKSQRHGFQCKTTLPSAGLLVAHAKFLLRCSSQFVNLAANLCSALSEVQVGLENLEIDPVQLRSDLEAAGNSVCEALKGLITQTKVVAGYLSTPSLEYSNLTKSKNQPAVSSPELERLIGAVSTVASTANTVKRIVMNSIHLLSGSRLNANKPS